MPAADIMTVTRAGDSLKNGALIGAVVGAIVAAGHLHRRRLGPGRSVVHRHRLQGGRVRLRDGDLSRASGCSSTARSRGARWSIARRGPSLLVGHAAPRAARRGRPGGPEILNRGFCTHNDHVETITQTKSFAALNLSAETLSSLDRWATRRRPTFSSRPSPSALAGKDLVVQSRTGTGKTVGVRHPDGGAHRHLQGRHTGRRPRPHARARHPGRGGDHAARPRQGREGGLHLRRRLDGPASSTRSGAARRSWRGPRAACSTISAAVLSCCLMATIRRAGNRWMRRGLPESGSRRGGPRAP